MSKYLNYFMSKAEMTMRKSVWLIVLFFVCAFFVSGCNSNPTKSVQDLHAQVKAYGKLIRWRAYEDANDFVKPRDGSVAPFDASLLAEIRVTKYEVSTIVLNESENEASVVTDISYYHERVNSVHELRDKQTWWKDEDSGRWFIDGSLPEFKP